MFCTKCGTQLADDSKFCYKCGAEMNPSAEPKDTVLQGELDDAVTEKPDAATQPAADPATATQPTQQAAISSATADGILSILGFVFAFTAPLIGLILSLIGYQKPKYRNLAIAGIIIGTILLIALLVVAAFGFSNLDDPAIPLFILISAIM